MWQSDEMCVCRAEAPSKRPKATKLKRLFRPVFLLEMYWWNDVAFLKRLQKSTFRLCFQTFSLAFPKEKGHPFECPSLVGMTRFELATPRPPDVCATKLRYIPISLLWLYHFCVKMSIVFLRKLFIFAEAFYFCVFLDAQNQNTKNSRSNKAGSFLNVQCNCVGFIKFALDFLQLRQSLPRKLLSR